MKLLTLCLLAIATISITGCQRFRELTRPSYAALTADPFALDTGIDTEAPEPVPVKSGGVGVGRLAGSAPKDPQTTADRSDYSRIMHTAGSQKDGTTDPRLAQMQPERNSLFTDSTQERNTSDPPPDIDEMAAFFHEEAIESGLTETADQLSHDFAQFTEARQREWDQEAMRRHDRAIQQVSQTRESYTALQSELQSSVDEFDQIRQETARQLQARREELAREFAEPLIPEGSGSVGTASGTGFTRPRPVNSPEPVTAEPLIFDDPDSAPVRDTRRPRRPERQAAAEPEVRQRVARTSEPATSATAEEPSFDFDEDVFGGEAGRKAVPLEPPRPTVRRMPPRQVEQQDDSPFARFRTDDQKRLDGFGWHPSGTVEH